MADYKLAQYNKMKGCYHGRHVFFMLESSLVEMHSHACSNYTLLHGFTVHKLLHDCTYIISVVKKTDEQW